MLNVRCIEYNILNSMQPCKSRGRVIRMRIKAVDKEIHGVQFQLNSKKFINLIIWLINENGILDTSLLLLFFFSSTDYICVCVCLYTLIYIVL